MELTTKTISWSADRTPRCTQHGNTWKGYGSFLVARIGWPATATSFSTNSKWALPHWWKSSTNELFRNLRDVNYKCDYQCTKKCVHKLCCVAVLWTSRRNQKRHRLIGLRLMRFVTLVKDSETTFIPKRKMFWCTDWFVVFLVIRLGVVF